PPRRCAVSPDPRNSRDTGFLAGGNHGRKRRDASASTTIRSLRSGGVKKQNPRRNSRGFLVFRWGPKFATVSPQRSGVSTCAPEEEERTALTLPLYDVVWYAATSVVVHQSTRYLYGTSRTPCLLSLRRKGDENRCEGPCHL